MIDVNAYLSHWPFRRLPLDEADKLIARYRRVGITQAWVSTFDAMLHTDLAGANARLTQECQRAKDLLIPIGSVNPTQPDWKEDLRRCVEVHQMPGLRLHPTYHGYELDAPACRELLALADQHRLIVQIPVRLDDERTQHRRLVTPAVNVAPLKDVLKEHPKLVVMMLNSQRDVRLAQQDRIVSAGEVYLDIAGQEGVEGVANLISQVSIDRILFGTYAPMFTVESAILKLAESPLTDAQLEAITVGNARRLLSM